ncbi:RNA polymerase sigma factor [Pseudogemmobacter faecipullorum]|uniref:RNA polymerase sigma factor n=1 Tax=Pseudogemmobacter faecipullorum TaxID=2755041 RepID=A0ABS8CKE4_9RHOB|nr:RNA polymerase sigma factor [Pseudogemmobacter faecipullorum]MCB5409864.1 RNA polymerase sigma factor [Pseudogemmobacter faecipullorum]
MARDMQNEPDDAALLALYGSGDPQAARLLAARLLPRVLGFATRMLGGDRAEAEDVAQEAMLRLWRAAPGWRSGEAQVSTWLYRVTANLVTDRLRSRQRRRLNAGGGELSLDEAVDPPDDSPGAEARLIAAERLAALDQGLAGLPERQRQALVLRHIEGLSNPEIAMVMGLGVEAVESLTARARRGLATLLQDRRESLGFEGD